VAILMGSGSICSYAITCPTKVALLRSILHFLGLNVNPDCWIVCRNVWSCSRWSSHVIENTAISSTKGSVNSLIGYRITCSAVVLSRVLRTALVPYGNMKISTPHSSETSQVITMILCTCDYVRETNTCAKFGWNPPAKGRSYTSCDFFFSAFFPYFLFVLAHLQRPNR